MELNKIQSTNLKPDNLPSTQKPIGETIISVEECKKYLGDFELSDENAKDIKNNLVGIVNSVISIYLEDFR